jgi:hypothetical protein
MVWSQNYFIARMLRLLLLLLLVYYYYYYENYYIAEAFAKYFKQLKQCSPRQFPLFIIGNNIVISSTYF